MRSGVVTCTMDVGGGVDATAESTRFGCVNVSGSGGICRGYDRVVCHGGGSRRLGSMQGDDGDIGGEIENSAEVAGSSNTRAS